MGYSHYWYRPKTIPLATWRKISIDIARLVAAFPDTVVWTGNILAMRPELSDDMIEFNGPDGKDYEPFRLTRIKEIKPGERPKDDGLWFDFCKTERRPYDLLVAASLLVLKHWLSNGVRVMSDGNDKDWSGEPTGRENSLGPKAFCQGVLGYGLEYFINEHSEVVHGKK